MEEKQVKSPETQDNTFEKIVSTILLILREKDWARKLLLIDILIFLFLNKIAVSTVLEIFGQEQLLNNIPYPSIWGGIVAMIFIVAVIGALIKPSEDKPTMQNKLKDSSPIKGLRPFEPKDANIFAKMQRREIISECLNAITYSDFRFGIITGESGSGKTSFVQAGLKANFPKSDHNCVYIKFTHLDPLVVVRLELIKQLKLSTEPDNEIDGTDLIELFEYAVKIENKPIVFIFDQFEQFFICNQTKEERAPFIQVLAAWYKKYSSLPIKILVSIRGDFNDHMIELQKAMEYTIGPQQHFRLEKFTPMQAIEIFRLIARVEQMKFDERFVKELTEEELASKDGLISPVDMQVLAWMIKGQSNVEEKAFDRKTYAKLGGIEGLLEIFLKRSLDALMSKEKRENALNVLLTLIDSDRHICSRVLTLNDLQEKLSTLLNKKEVEDIVNWLVRHDVRLISPNKGGNNIKGYEISHEKIIPVIRKLAGKELSENARANSLLERRVNEWIGNDFKSRYLLRWNELKLIKRHKNNLTWGNLKTYKEKIIEKSEKKCKIRFAVFAVSLMITILFATWWYSPYGQIQKIKWKLDDLVSNNKVIDDKVMQNIAVAYALNDNLEKSLDIAEKIVKSTLKSQNLLEIIKILTKINKIDEAIYLSEKLEDTYNRVQALVEIAKKFALKKVDVQIKKLDILLDRSISENDLIKNPYNKFKILQDLSIFLVQIGQIEKAIPIYQKIENPFYRSIISLEMAKLCSNSKNKETKNNLLHRAIADSKKVADSYLKAQIIAAMANIFFVNKEIVEAKKLLDKAISESEKIKNSSNKYENFRLIARICAQHKEIKQALSIAKKIDENINKADVCLEITKIMIKNSYPNNELLKPWRMAIFAAKAIKDEPIREPRMIEAVKILAEHGEIKRAISFAEEMKTPYLRSMVLAEIAKILAYGSETNIFNRVVNRALLESQKIKKYYVNHKTSNTSEISIKKDKALIAIVNAYSHAKKWGKALIIADRIGDNNKVADALANILKIWASKGRI